MGKSEEIKGGMEEKGEGRKKEGSRDEGMEGRTDRGRAGLTTPVIASSSPNYAKDRDTSRKLNNFTPFWHPV